MFNPLEPKGNYTYVPSPLTIDNFAICIYCPFYLCNGELLYFLLLHGLNYYMIFRRVSALKGECCY